MKKTLLAAALLAGFAGAASAQNSVTLYGRLTPALVYENVKVSQQVADAYNAGKAATAPAIAAGTFSQTAPVSGYAPGGSLWGMKGVEDLGNGLKVGFDYEQNVDIDNGAASGFTRKASLTVSGDAWGRVTVGRDFAASDTILAGISPLGTAYGVGSAQRAFGVYSLNVQNMVRYLSPSFSGVTVGLTYSFGGTTVVPTPGSETFGNSTKNRLFGAGLRYANGPILVAGNYTQVMPRNNFGNTTPKNWLVGGSYDFKVVKAHLAYGQNIDGVISGTTGLEALGGASGTDFGVIGSDTLARQGARTNQWMAGLSAPLGNGTAMFSISQMRPGGNLDTAITSTMTNLGIAYSYNLSKRTSVYASYSYANNYSMLEGLKVNQVGAGIVHLF